MTKILTLILCLGSVVAAQPAKPGPAVPPAAAPTKVTGDQAKGLIRALKLAAAKSSTAKTKTTWAAKLLDCTTTKPKDPTTLEVTECQADDKKFIGAAAVVLEAAMTKAEIPAPYYMGKSQIKAASLTCVMDEHPTGEDGPFVCTYTPVGR